MPDRVLQKHNCVAATTTTGPAAAKGASTASTASPSDPALAFVNCMRTHGEPNMPDPVIEGAACTSWSAKRRWWAMIPLGDVYRMRMARVNITIPDELYEQAKRAGLNVSQAAQQAVAAELARLAKIAELDGYLAELDAELGPISAAERANAVAWADKALESSNRRRSA
jgi:post-segregation antitoxin (ccd killing protein)